LNCGDPTVPFDKFVESATGGWIHQSENQEWAECRGKSVDQERSSERLTKTDKSNRAAKKVGDEDLGTDQNRLPKMIDLEVVEKIVDERGNDGICPNRN
jgi:hypothetical protein